MPLLLLLFACLLPAAAAASPTVWPRPQQQWLAAHPVLRVGLVLRPPYVIYDAESREYRGADIDLMRLLQRRLGVAFKVVPAGDEAELERLGVRHDIDLAFGVEETPHRLRFWLFSQPYLKVPFLMVARAQAPVPASPGDLGEASVVLTDVTLDRFLLRNYPLLLRETVVSTQEALHRTHAGTAHAALIDGAEVRYWLGGPVFRDLRIGGEVGFYTAPRVAVRDDWPLLSDILDRALASIPRSDLQQIEQSWIDPGRHPWWEGGAFWGAIALLALLAALTFALLTMNNRRLNRAIELQLRQREEELQLRHAQALQLLHSQFTMDHSPIGILRLYWDGRIQYANQALCDSLGQPQLQVQGMRLQDIDPSLDQRDWLTFWKSLRQRRFLAYESRHRCRDGRFIPVEVHACLLSYDNREYLVLFVSDISERQRIRGALEASEARFRELANHVPGMVFQLRQESDDSPPDLVYLSDACADICGFPASVVLADPDQLFGIVHPQDLAGFRASLTLAMQGGEAWNWQGRVVTVLSQERWVDLKASRRRDAQGVSTWDGMAWDITANKRSEQSLAESRWLLRELAAHHEALREKEKASIAREVHDELGQMLTALKIETSMCEMAVGASRPDVMQRLSGMKKSIDQTLQIARNVVTALRPPALDLGLAAALEWLAQRIVDRLSLHCDVDIAEGLPELDDARAVILFRIVQEALTNVARHAAASHVVIRLAYTDAELVLKVEDDGRGFDPAAMSRSFGLVGIRERVWMLRGSVEVDSAPGAGARIIVRIPFTDKAVT
ncbi:PAS domain-containing sensor histidine kinase [Paludibacterium yongneupense]|uniref:PAS domain-containing sensor histidine kinase n=1 Tax=Paludibacterium yongneupense TaxID=400061 RepID=UPI00041A4B84|nr:sensor histidine kinase [Paludibacterium yongneupense]